MGARFGIRVAVAALLGACSTAGADKEVGEGIEPTTFTPTSGAADDGGADGGSTSAMTTAVPTSGDSGFKFDLADADTLGSRGPCDKVDFLFAIDTSGSMGAEQALLANAFPGFAAAMAATLDTVESVQIGVVASGPYAGNNPPACAVQGGLVTQTACLPFADGMRFITGADDISTAFTCNAALGTGGPGDNTTMQNVFTAVSSMQGAGECNEAFVRSDALLVIVIITDEEDDHDNPPGYSYFGSPGDPPDWFATVVAAKGGIETNVAVVAIVQPPEPNACPAGQNTPEQKTWFEANRIIAFTQLFTHGFVGDICDQTYVTHLEQALGVIDLACDEFTPEG